MIAVAFGSEEVLGHDAGLERAALLHAVRTDTLEHGDAFDEAEAALTIERILAAGAGGPDRLASAGRVFMSLRGEDADLPALLARFERFAVASAPDYFQASPGVAQILQALESLAVPHVLVTAGSTEIVQRMADSIGFTGRVVPAASVDEPAGPFGAVPDATGVPFDRIYLVGADPRRDLEPALRAGMQTVWLDSGQRYPADCRPPAFAITNLAELVDILREPYTRSLLGLRYILHSVARWRSGHFLPGVEYGLNRTRQ